ncbi:glycosyltransferase family 2 protein [Alkalicoccobacillus gibsonii]|uniref:glycosyltransferase family 2 protein n=1 Tax=Alkalicoccobacillus gibsonii TaxID=79881 RepID=UPI003510EFA4
MGISNFFKTKVNERENYFKKYSYRIVNESALSQKRKVSVVVPVYNAKEYLRKTVDSVIQQNLGFHEITLILVDDLSNDGSQSILKEYARIYENIVVVYLEENTGTPAFPRNLGVELSNAETVTFLDADDWLSRTALKTLYDLLVESNVNYVVGKTIQEEKDKQKIIGRYESFEKRKKVSPFSIPHIFYHLGPRARMMNLNFIKDNDIRFPEMKFAEDKQFFIDVYTQCGLISTTSEPIYHLNRIENNDSLTKRTNIMEKTDTNISVLKYVLDKKLEIEKEKMIVNRLVEFDLMTRMFERNHFIKSKDKQEYYKKFKQAISLLKKRPYDISETFFKPIHKIGYKLLLQSKFDEVATLYTWSKNNNEKEILIEDKKAQYITKLNPLEEVKIEIPLYAELQTESVQEDKYMAKILLFGYETNSVSHLEFQSRNDATKSYLVPVKLSENSCEIELPLEKLRQFENGGYVMYLLYNEYERVTIIKKSNEKFELIDSQQIYTLYQTIKGNLSIKVNNT